MQPLLKHKTYGPVIGWPLSTITRVPGWSDMPSGSVTRSTFVESCSGWISTAATTGIPDYARPSLPVKQICKIFMALASSPFCLALASPPRQNLVHGEKVSCGCSACACGCCCACGAGVSAGFCAGAAFGAALGAALCAAGVVGARGGRAWADTAAPGNAVSMVVAAATENVHAVGPACAKTDRV